MTLKKRLLNWLIAVDAMVLVTVTLGGAYPDETISSAAYKAEKNGQFFGLFRPVIDALLWFDKDHCHQAYLSEVLRSQLPEGYTNPNL